MTDSDRNEWDEMVDEAIEVLIEDSTEAFVLVGMQEDADTHLVQVTDCVEQELLAAYMAVENVRRMTEQAGDPMHPMEVLVAAGRVAAEFGYLDDEAEWASYRE